MPQPEQERKPHGPELARAIFGVGGADLLIGGVAVRQIVTEAGSPVYIYDGEVMRRSHHALADALEGFADIHYSVKANPAVAVIRLFLEEGAGVEIASAGEYDAARQAGAAPERILFAGPGKRLRELEKVIAEGIGEIHLETAEEIARVAAIGRQREQPVRASLRINPGADAQAGAMRMGGKPTAFGFCEEDIADVVQAVTAAGHIDLVGVHVYGGTQILDASALVNQWRHAIRIASEIAVRIGRPLRTIDVGGGLGIPYHAGDTELDLSAVKAAIPALKEQLGVDPLLAGARIVVEPGRFLAGPGGAYVMEINAVKQSRGTRFLITDGGMHHHLAASGNLGQIIKRDYPIVAPTRMDETQLMPAAVVGPLCTPLDTLARDALLPDLVAGDLIAVLQSGAYGPTASPSRFLGHPPAVEVLAEAGRFEVL